MLTLLTKATSMEHPDGPPTHTAEHEEPSRSLHESQTATTEHLQATTTTNQNDTANDAHEYPES
eukprot:6347072-Prorocentrum_lima.AAC.1